MKSGEPEVDSKPRPEKLLDHIARYDVTLRAIAKRMFSEESDSINEKLFSKLAAQGRIDTFSLTTSPRRSYYRLSSDELKKRGLKRPAGKLSAGDLLRAIGVLLFCFKKTTLRWKVSAESVQRKLDFPLASATAPYIVEKRPEGYLGRVIVPGAKALPKNAIDIVYAETVEHFERFPDARVWLEAGGLRYVVLVHSPARASLFREAIAAARSRELRPIPAYVRVDVEEIPDVLAQRTRKAPQ